MTDRVENFGNGVMATREKGGWVSLWLRSHEADDVAGGMVPGPSLIESLDAAARWVEELSTSTS